MILLGYCAWSLWRYGNVTDGIAFLNGFVLVAEKPTLELGDVSVGSKAEGVFILKNLTNQPITILGAKPECPCVVTSELPVQVDRLSSSPFRLRFVPRTQEANQSVAYRTLLYLDVDSPSIILTLAASVHPASTTPVESEVMGSSPSSEASREITCASSSAKVLRVNDVFLKGD